MADVMKPGFRGPEWARLTVAERVAQCHIYAREAAQLAQAAGPEAKAQFREIAAAWNTLAAEMEEAAREDR